MSLSVLFNRTRGCELCYLWRIKNAGLFLGCLVVYERGVQELLPGMKIMQLIVFLMSYSMGLIEGGRK